MKFRIFFFAAIALITASCNNETIEPGTVVKDKPKNQVLNITASFEEPAETRAYLEETGTTVIKAIGFRWETTDEIQFCFEQGGTADKNTANITAVSADGKTAQFTVTVPAGIDVGNPYTLYAYRSSRKSEITTGSVLDPITPTVAVLPAAQFNYLATLADQATVFSIWSKKVIDPAMTTISLSFKHLGSMMTLNLKNVGSATISDLHSIVLQTNPSQNWIINRLNGNGGALFDMAAETYVGGSEQFSTTLTFFTPSATLAPDEVGTYYLWFVPKTDIAAFDLMLASLKSPGTPSDITGLTNVNKSITRSLQTGKNYLLFATIENDESTTPPRPYLLKFTDSSYVAP
ncbi:hypothetical protein DSECCO2_115350 [anaerobic digester metagenome]